MSSHDKDFRYMALADLATELDKDTFAFDAASSERSLGQLVVRALSDTSGDVGTLAVRAASLLALRGSEEGVRLLGHHLSHQLLSGADEHARDAASMALKAVLASAPRSRDAALSASLAVPLSAGLVAPQADVRAQAVDVLTEAVPRLGTLLPDRPALAAAALRVVQQPGAALRKRAISALGALAGTLAPADLGALARQAAAPLPDRPAGDAARARAAAQALAASCRCAGHAFSDLVPELAPRLLKAGGCRSSGAGPEGWEEVREACLQALEAFAARCPEALDEELRGEVLEAACASLRYDPNFVPAEGEGEGGSGDEDAFSDDGSYSDDEDASWKVRRAGAALLGCVAASLAPGPSLEAVFHAALPPLLRAAADREETVRVESLRVVALLLRLAASGAADEPGARPAPPGLERALASHGAADALARALARALQSRSQKTAAAGMAALAELAELAPAALAEPASPRLCALLPGLKACLEQSPVLRSEALGCAAGLARALAPGGRRWGQGPGLALLRALASGVARCAADASPKAAAQALKTASALLGSVRGGLGGGGGAPSAPLAPEDAASVRVLASAAAGALAPPGRPDPEVAEAALEAAGVALGDLGDVLDGEGGGSPVGVTSLARELAAMPRTSKRAKLGTSGAGGAEPDSPSPASLLVPLLLLHVREEPASPAAARALERVALSPLRVDLSAVAGPCAAALAHALAAPRCARELRVPALGALRALFLAHAEAGGPVDDAALREGLRLAASFFEDEELAVAARALALAEAALDARPRATAELAAEVVLPLALALAGSPVVQGAAAEALRRALEALVRAGRAAGAAAPEALSFESVRAGLLGRAAEPGAARAGQETCALCLASLAAGLGAREAQDTARELLRELEEESAAPDARRREHVALLCLGELGRRCELGALPALPAALTASLADESRAEAAARALGGVAAGSLEQYLPLLLDSLRAGGGAGAPPPRYQLLRALEEVLASVVGSRGAQADAASQGAHALSAAQAPAGRLSRALERQTLAVLLELPSDEDESAGALGECLGRLALLAPDLVLEALARDLDAERAPVRARALSALRHALLDRPHAADAALEPLVAQGVLKMEDADLAVRRACVGLLAACLHAKPALAREPLRRGLDGLVAQMRLNRELVRVVDLGPFKHQIDDGLELRKKAFEAVGAAAALLPAVADHPDLFQRLQEGLRDAYDVKVVAHVLLARLARRAPRAVCRHLEPLGKALAEGLAAKVKTDAVKQEVDRHEDLVRSTLRAVDAVDAIPEADHSPAWKAFMDSSVLTPAMKPKFAAIVEERVQSGG